MPSVVQAPSRGTPLLEKYNQPIYQPPGYWSSLPSDPGVAAGSRTWRWIPSAVNLRQEARQNHDEE